MNAAHEVGAWPRPPGLGRRPSRTRELPGVESRLRATFAWLMRLPKDAVLGGAVGLVALIGWLDYLTNDFSLSFFYLLPVAVATWCAGVSGGWAVGLLSASVWFTANILDESGLARPAFSWWDAVMLFASNGVVVHLLAALHRLQSELEARVARRTASLAQANAELEAAKLQVIEAAKLEMLGKLAAGLAHEVKNPLTAILMATDVLADSAAHGEAPPEPVVEALRHAATQAARVIGEMLDFSRPGGIAIRLNDFHEVAERALGLVKPEICRKNLVVQREWGAPTATIPFDRYKIEQVLLNLLFNAIQATPAGGTITVRTSLARPAGLTVEVDDSGPGIAPEHRDKLFEPFFTTKPRGQGTGLGLSVSRQIVRLHGGTLELDNRPDAPGARATIRLPA